MNTCTDNKVASIAGYLEATGLAKMEFLNQVSSQAIGILCWVDSLPCQYSIPLFDFNRGTCAKESFIYSKAQSKNVSGLIYISVADALSLLYEDKPQSLKEFCVTNQVVFTEPNSNIVYDPDVQGAPTIDDIVEYLDNEALELMDDASISADTRLEKTLNRAAANYWYDYRDKKCRSARKNERQSHTSLPEVSSDLKGQISKFVHDRFYRPKATTEVITEQQATYKDLISIVSLLDEKYGINGWCRVSATVSNRLVLKNNSQLRDVRPRCESYVVSPNDLVVVDNIDSYSEVTDSSSPTIENNDKEPSLMKKRWSMSDFVTEVEEQFWATYDPDCPLTMPTIGEIVSWLKDKYGLPAGRAKSIEDVARNGRHNRGG